MTNPSKIFDGLLVLQYREGSKTALPFLVSKYHKKLCMHSYNYTKNMDISKDIVQDCWKIIIKKQHTLKDPNLFSSWAFKIVTRKSLDLINKKKKEQEKLYDYYEASSATENEDDAILNIEKVQIAIQKLSKDQKAVIRLFYKECYSLREISEIVGVSVGTVKSRLFHAREKLKVILK